MNAFIMLCFTDEHGNNLDVRLDTISGIVQVEDRPNIRRLDTVARSYFVRETRAEILDRMQEAISKAQDMGIL